MMMEFFLKEPSMDIQDVRSIALHRHVQSPLVARGCFANGLACKSVAMDCSCLDSVLSFRPAGVLSSASARNSWRTLKKLRIESLEELSEIALQERCREFTSEAHNRRRRLKRQRR